MKSNPHRVSKFHYDKIIVGSSLEAMMVAYKYNIPIFGNSEHKPLPYSYIPPDIDLSPLQCENIVEEFGYLSGKKETRGMQRIELWNAIFYRLHMMGLVPFWGSFNYKLLEDMPTYDNIKHIHFQHQNKMIELTFDKLILFDYPKYELGRMYFHVNDYIDIKTVYDFPANLYLSKDCDFMATMCYETIFFKRNAKMHGCCVKSIIHEDHIDDWNYSQTSVRMKTESDIFWNIDKAIKIKTGKRERAPLLNKLTYSIEEILHLDSLDEEIYD
tara:strand:- start:1567 stop:2379 length:813 start_codon:yes stop_codon:yes gene_type:complete